MHKKDSLEKMIRLRLPYAHPFLFIFLMPVRRRGKLNVRQGRSKVCLKNWKEISYTGPQIVILTGKQLCQAINIHLCVNVLPAAAARLLQSLRISSFLKIQIKITFPAVCYQFYNYVNHFQFWSENVNKQIDALHHFYAKSFDVHLYASCCQTFAKPEDFLLFKDLD